MLLSLLFILFTFFMRLNILFKTLIRIISYFLMIYSDFHFLQYFKYINFKDFVLPKDVLELLELIIFFMGTFPIILIINSNLKYKKKITIFSKFYINFFKFPINLTIFIFLNYFIIRITTKCLTTS